MPLKLLLQGVLSVYYRPRSGWWCIHCCASVRLSVRPSVCLSVTKISQECIKISTLNRTWDIS